jgi:hypothetical protein
MAEATPNITENTLVVEGDGKVSDESTIKAPKNCKENRYYYRHREELLEKRRLKRLQDPEYQAKQKAKEEAKQKAKEEALKKKEEERLKKLKAKEEANKLHEEERKKQIEERFREKAKKKAELLGVTPLKPSGVKINRDD